MRLLLVTLMLLSGSYCKAQSLVITTADTSSERIKKAIHFLERYLSSFERKEVPDYKQYWSMADCKRSLLPDNMAYTIQSDVPTYNFCDRPVLFFARDEHHYIHLKTLFASIDSGKIVYVWVITNHYVNLDGPPRFVSELELHKGDYKSVRNRNITYHFPASTNFSYARSNQMMARLEQIEKQWGFKPVDINYYFAANDVELAKMRGLDYNYLMDEATPSGMTYTEDYLL